MRMRDDERRWEGRGARAESKRPSRETSRSVRLRESYHIDK